MQNLIAKLPILATLAGLLSACAPDSIDNIQAKGFNTYLDTLQTRCNNFYIGSYNVQSWLQHSGVESNSTDDQYTYWLDATSRLYYNRLSAARYRSDVEGMLGRGEHNDQSFACIMRYLPAHRPDKPATWLP